MIIKTDNFKLDDVFEKIDTLKIKGQANDFPREYSDEYCIPLLTASTTNQGFSRYAKREDCPTIIRNAISVSANGTAIAFYQPFEFSVLQDSYALKLNGTDLTENIGLYLVAVLNKLLTQENFNWTKKSGWNKIKNLTISLPVDNNGDIDWNFMSSYIKTIKKG